MSKCNCRDGWSTWCEFIGFVTTALLLLGAVFLFMWHILIHVNLKDTNKRISFLELDKTRIDSQIACLWDANFSAVRNKDSVMGEINSLRKELERKQDKDTTYCVTNNLWTYPIAVTNYYWYGSDSNVITLVNK